jgi:hypothetical protein
MYITDSINQESNMFYVYVYKDPRPTKNQQVVYVGKGTGDRAWVHWKRRVKGNKGFGAFLALLRREKLEPLIELVKDKLDEAEAFYEEMRLIQTYGRRDLGTGTLFNLTDGGEGFSNVVRTDEWRQNLSIAHSTPEKISAYSEGQKRRWANPTFREQAVAAIRKALQDPEVIARREAGKAAFIHTEAFRQTMSKATSKMWQDPAYVEKVTQAQKEVQGTEEARANKSEASVATWADSTVRDKRTEGIKRSRTTDVSRQKTSEQSKAQWADPEYAAKQTANNKEIANRDEVKAAKKAAAKALWADPEWRAKMLAARKKRIDTTPTT